MIPELPSDVSYQVRRDYYHKLLSQLEISSLSHIKWFTHKNPYGCWICDMVMLCRTLLNYLDDMDSNNLSPQD